VRLDNVIISSPEVFLVRGKTGDLNVVSLLPEREGPAEADKASEDRKAKEEKEPEASFAVEVGDFRLAGGKVSFSDLSSSNPLQATATLEL
jgi:hypothetical protein